MSVFGSSREFHREHILVDDATHRDSVSMCLLRKIVSSVVRASESFVVDRSVSWPGQDHCGRNRTLSKVVYNLEVCPLSLALRYSSFTISISLSPCECFTLNLSLSLSPPLRVAFISLISHTHNLFFLFIVLFLVFSLFSFHLCHTFAPTISDFVSVTVNRCSLESNVDSDHTRVEFTCWLRAHYERLFSMR